MASSTQRRKKNKRARRRKKIIILSIEIIVVLLLLAGVYIGVLYSKMKNNDFNKDALYSNEELKKEGYTTIALFGLDSRDVESLGKDNHSDTIIIASINNKTKEVKLASVYRDTYVQIPDDDYNRANAAYFLGGPEKAISMLNMNLDLTIKDYVTINFMALVDVIDQLGGIDIDVQENEVEHLNAYLVETSKITGIEAPDIEGPGLHKLSGLQATAYCRIRYGGGDDYRRTERQRLVISKIIEEVKKSDPATITKIANSVIDDKMVNTSIEPADMIALVASATSYELGETTGFPYTKIADVNVTGRNEVIACGFAYNVSKLHEFLYNDENYEVSSKVQEISDYIMDLTGVQQEEIEGDTTPDTLTVPASE